MSALAQLSISDCLEISLFIVLIVFLAPLMGVWMSKALQTGKKGEAWLFRLCGVDSTVEMTWRTYLRAILIFNGIGLVVLLAILMSQGFLPLNPDGRAGLDFPIALNIAISFVTNTNWQVYAGEESLSHLSQMLGLGVQNFLSAGTSLAVLICLARSLKRRLSPTVGHFGVDLLRSVLYILLPVSLVFGIFLNSQGVPQNFSKAVTATTLEGEPQSLTQGPVASQIAIKILGSNGGGYYNANSAHPYENPSPLTNFISILLMLLLPVGSLFLFGNLIGDRGHAWAIFFAVFVIFIPCLFLSLMAQMGENPSVHGLPFFEGIETRFGGASSVLWSVVTTATSNGSVNAQLSSMSPLSGFVCLFLMMTGEVVWGGVGVGAYSLVMFAIITVFMAGLMVGRTPEYMGKKIQAHEMVWASVGVLGPGILILMLSGLASVSPMALEALKHGGPHGLTEILYAFTSATDNNGSAFGGLNATNSFFLWGTSLAMLAGRFLVLIPAVILAGSFAEKKTTPPSSGTFPTNGLTFSILLFGVIILVGALTFFPAVALGPILEHLFMMQGRVIVP